MSLLLSEEQVTAQLSLLSGWKKLEARSAIEKSFQFNDFIAAFSFMTQVALLAEKFQHHPEWFNCYHRVVITLSTHDAGGVTEKDFILAQAIDRIRDGAQKNSAHI